MTVNLNVFPGPENFRVGSTSLAATYTSGTPLLAEDGTPLLAEDGTPLVAE